MKKISIIMPVYNTEKYLKESIESVCNQSFDGVELIIVNDGSTDNSENIIKEMMIKHNNIIYISQKNMGLSYARKVGLNHSSGEYIFFMDSDDMIYPDTLEYMYNEAKNNDLDCLMVNAVFKNELQNDYGYRMDKKYVVSKMDETQVVTGNELLERMIKNREWRYAVWLYFIKKSSLDNVTFFKYFIHEDSAFNYELLSGANKVKFVNKNVYMYRLRENSLMSIKQSVKNILGYINSYLIICKRNDKKERKYENYLFEIRILDQIIEVYEYLPKDEQEKSREEFKRIIPILKKRNCYYIDRYRDFFVPRKENAIKKTDVLDYIEYLEVDIVDHCNLNCNNCMHFSQLAHKGFMDKTSFERDIKRISEITKLNNLVLMGGEPLLHPEINLFLEIARKYLKDTSIQIVTNGLLLSSMSEEFWNTCKKYDIQINITPYPINIDYYKLYNKVLDRGLKLFIYSDGITSGKEFTSLQFDSSKSQDAFKNFNNCSMAKNYANLKNGKIFICPVINNIARYNKYYGTDYQVKENDYIDIYKTSKEEICSYLASPTSFCSYCDLKKRSRLKWRRFKDEN